MQAKSRSDSDLVQTEFRPHSMGEKEEQNPAIPDPEQGRNQVWNQEESDHCFGRFPGHFDPVSRGLMKPENRLQ